MKTILFALLGLSLAFAGKKDGDVEALKTMVAEINTLGKEFQNLSFADTVNGKDHYWLILFQNCKSIKNEIDNLSDLISIQGNSSCGQDKATSEAIGKMKYRIRSNLGELSIVASMNPNTLGSDYYTGKTKRIKEIVTDIQDKYLKI